jgi:hypothetical protein
MSGKYREISFGLTKPNFTISSIFSLKNLLEEQC